MVTVVKLPQRRSSMDRIFALILELQCFHPNEAELKKLGSTPTPPLVTNILSLSLYEFFLNTEQVLFSWFPTSSPLSLA